MKSSASSNFPPLYGRNSATVNSDVKLYGDGCANSAKNFASRYEDGGVVVEAAGRGFKIEETVYELFAAETENRPLTED